MVKVTDGHQQSFLTTCHSYSNGGKNCIRRTPTLSDASVCSFSQGKKLNGLKLSYNAPSSIRTKVHYTVMCKDENKINILKKSSQQQSNINILSFFL